MRRTRGYSADADLAKLFDALAPILIPLDITPSRLAQIARASFVKVGATHAKMKSSGRPHLARIAALIGLSRSEVKRIVASGYRVESSGSDNLPRALRVLNAWRLLAAQTSSEKPRQLSIIGKTPSFQALCKSHSGDIPYTVILDELERRQCVIVSRKRNKVAIAKPKQRSRAAREQAVLTFATEFLHDALKDEYVLVRRKQKIASSSNLSEAYVETAIASRLTDLLDQLPKLFTNRKQPKRNIVTVFTLVSKHKHKK